MSLEENKIIQRAELYLTQKNTQELILARHITNWDTYLKVCQDLAIDQKDRIYLDDVDMPAIGLQIKQWPEKEPEVTIRKMAILGTCLIRCEWMWAEIGGTHVIANRPSFTDYEALRQIYKEYMEGKRENFVKVIYNLRMPNGSVPTTKWIEEQVEEKMKWPIVGGWWCDDGIRGEEPDAQPWTPEYAEQQLQLRQNLYTEVRIFDPDKTNRPFTEQFNMTEQGIVKGHWRSGWKGQWREKPRTCDIVLIDTYPFDQSDDVMREQLTDSFEKFPKPYCRDTQVIGQINACSFRPGSIRIAYEVWKELINSPDFDNPYKGSIALAFYKDEYVRKNEDMQAEIREVNEEIMRG